MKDLMLKIRWQRTLIVIGFMGGLATLSFNCAPSLMQSADYSYLNRYSTAGEDLFEAPKDSPWVLMNTFQIYSTMANVTGQTFAVGQQQRGEYELRTGALSQTDKLTDINAPLQMGATSVAGEFCNGLISREAASGAVRKFFTGVNFGAGPAGNTTQAFRDAIDAMSLSFYGRPLSAEEVSILTAYYDDFVSTAGNTAGDTRDLYLATCSAMLASFDAITF